MKIVNEIIDAINRCPDYIGKGIFQLVIFTLGGVLVAWIATKLFGRRSEINAVEGVLLKRKMDIYEELSGKLEALKSMFIIPDDLHEAAVAVLNEAELAFNPINSDQLLSIFDSPQSLSEAYLELDKYIASKKLYYDHDVMIQTLRFQNYFATFRRFLVMFEEQFVNVGIPLDRNEVAAAERLLTVEIGIILQEELIEQIDKVISTMKQSMMNLDFKHRDQIEYNYDFFNNPEKPIMSALINTRMMTEREKISLVITKAVAEGMVNCMKTGRKK